MNFAILVGLLVAVLGANSPAVCWPPACSIDANCNDDIHDIVDGKCCGGVCVDINRLSNNRVIGESCRDTSGTINVFETCSGTCGAGLFCSDTTKTCHALGAPGCNCTEPSHCLSGQCRYTNVVGANYTVCRAYRTTAEGGPCDGDDQCISNFCNGVSKQCTRIPDGEACSYSYPERCGVGATCKYNASFYYSCAPLCANGVVGCCSYAYDCANYTSDTRTVCANSTCQLPTPVLLPGLGEPCPASKCKNRSHICASPCASAGCVDADVCQETYKFPVGHICESSRTNQCQRNSTCQYGGLGSDYTCVALYSIPLGQSCATSASDQMCAPPATVCGSNGVDRICKANASTPAGDPCVMSKTLECVNGTQCAYNAVFNPVCTPLLRPGMGCTIGTPMCEGGPKNCVEPSASSSTGCYSLSNGCTCTIGRTVPDGGACNGTVQCSGQFSECVSNGTCASIIGKECGSFYDCYNSYYPYSAFDCSCNRQCYLLNAPTPAPAPYVPTPYVDPCQKKLDAWLAVATTSFGFDVDDTVGYANFYDLVGEALRLSTADRATLIDAVCCYTCRSSTRFNSRTFWGYQVDCAGRTLTKLPDICDDRKNNLAFLSCWAATSSAATTGLGFVSLMTALLF